METKSAETLLDELKRMGAANTVDGDGRKIFVVLSTNLGMPAEDRGVLIAYEGAGNVYLDMNDPQTVKINKFVLMQKGFSMFTAPLVLGVIQGLIEAGSGGLERPKRLT